MKWLVPLALLLGCSMDPTGETLMQGTSGSAVDPGTTGSGGDTGVANTGGSSSTSADTEETSSISTPDAGSPAFECSLFERTCPEGEKCSPLSSGGAGWDGTRCVPVSIDPDLVDEPCTLYASGASGLDSCDVGLLCWTATGQSEGICTPYCMGWGDGASCDDAARWCNDEGGPLGLCPAPCDPLDLASCHPSQGCHPAFPFPACGPVASDVRGGPFGACESSRECSPGLVCTNPTVVGICDTKAAGCCTPWCDLGDQACPEGTQCIPYYGDGEVGRMHKNIGLCGQDLR